MGKEVTVLFDYDSSVRGSMSDAFLIFDDEPIENPVVEEADIMLKLADKGHLRIHGRKVVAEGVENEEILDALQRMKCDIVQGYLFGRPVPLPELVERLSVGKAYRAA